MNYKKAFYISILLSLLASCSANPIKNAVEPISDIIRENLWINAFQTLIYGYPDYPLTREQVEAIPYASMRVKIGKGPAGLMILQKKEDQTYSWVSKDAILFQIKHGRIIRTSGLTNDLTDYYYTNDLPFKYLINQTQIKDNIQEKRKRRISKKVLNFFPTKTSKLPTSSRSISLSNPHVRALEVLVSLETVGKESISILDREYETILFKETVTNKTISWSHENLFWVDPFTGKVRKSIQQIAPNLPSILIELTKIPSE